MSKEADAMTMEQHRQTLPLAFDMRCRMAEEFERQMYSLKSHQYYSGPSFPSQETYVTIAINLI